VHPYEWIFCDVGNTLIQWYKRVSYDIEDRYGLARGELLNTAFGSPVGLQAMTGLLTHEDWIGALRTILPTGAVDEWVAYPGELDHGVAAILQSARSVGIRIALVSNASTALRAQLASHGLADVANAVVCSAEAGFAKPDPAIFRHALSVTQARPERVIYIDDVAAWARVAASCGMHALVYTDMPTLRRDLVALGLTWAGEPPQRERDA
jgi:HAD superfamily hydrolase (TIGR01509 family)